MSKLNISGYIIIILLLIPYIILSKEYEIEDELDDLLYIPDPFEQQTVNYEPEIDEEAIKLDHNHPVIESFKEEKKSHPKDFIHKMDISASGGTNQSIDINAIDGLEYKNIGYLINTGFTTLAERDELNNKRNFYIKTNLIYFPSTHISIGGEYGYAKNWNIITTTRDIVNHKNDIRFYTHIDISKHITLYSKSNVIYSEVKYKEKYENIELRESVNFNLIWPDLRNITKLNLNLQYSKMQGAPPYIKLIMISLNNDFPVKNKLFISLGGKVEFLLNNKTFLHPYMRLHYRVTKGIGLYLNYEPKLQYFSFSEYFVDEKYIIPVSPVEIQEDYFNLDFGLNYSVIEGVDINLSLFRKDSLNYIYIYDINSNQKEDNSEIGLRSISNLLQVTTNGVELSYIYTAIDNFEQSASITYEYISDDMNTISNIPYSPRIKFSAYMRLSPIKQFEFFIDGRYTSNYYSGTSGDLIGGYFLLNLNTTSWIKDKYGIIFGIDNITNKEYLITGEIPGYTRTFFAGFNLLI